MPELDGAKLFLILEVVLLHSIQKSSFSDNSMAFGENLALYVVAFINTMVPTFFIISGFLLFNNVERYDLATYKYKLKSRLRTLLVPYLLWNLIASFTFLFKVYCFHFDGYEVVSTGSFSLWGYLRGFWILQDVYPYDLPLWFLRDLIVYVVVSPVLYLIARSNIMSLILLLVYYAVDFIPTGLVYFVVGAWLAYHPEVYAKAGKKAICVAALVACLILAGVKVFVELPDSVEKMLYTMQVFSTFSFVLMLGRYIVNHKNAVSTALKQSYFFIFAVHGLFITVVCKFYIHLFGYASSASIISTYVLAFITLTLASMAAYYICRRISPKLAATLSGGR